MEHGRRLKSERGAVLVHAAVAMVGLLAFSAFSIDYGVMWTARRQAQNAADAAALAGAISMAYSAVDNQALARQSALAVAAQNLIWGAPPDVTETDITFPDPCPASPGFPAGGHCIRVDVFRNQRQDGNPLPVFFGRLAGLTEQGVRATATARVLFGGATNCLLPFSIPDRWVENWPNPQPWSNDATFDIDDPSGTPVANPDVYVPPSGGDPGTGFTRESLNPLTGADFGLQMTLRLNDPLVNGDRAAAGWYRPVRLSDDQSGLPDMLTAISECPSAVIGAGDSITTENGAMSAPQIAGAIDSVVDLDPSATWDASMNDGRGGVAGGCMAAGTCTLSPRIRPVAVYNPFEWAQGQTSLLATRVIGFFLERPIGESLVGRVMQYPSEFYEEGNGPEAANFIVTISLVR
jgi:Putative Flp pilus-assembly TadE/G-like